MLRIEDGQLQMTGPPVPPVPPSPPPLPPAATPTQPQQPPPPRTNHGRKPSLGSLASSGTSTSSSSSNGNNNNNNNGNHPYDLSTRCLLIRNLPKGFVSRSDLSDKNLPIGIQRMVYCESTRGSIMVEFETRKGRNKILGLDQERRRRLRRLRYPNQFPEGDADNQNNESERSGNYDKMLSFEMSVTVERCNSDRFVQKVLEGNKAEPDRGDSIIPTGEPIASVLSSSSSLAKRCVLIRKCAPAGSDGKFNKAEYDIPEAPSQPTTATPPPPANTNKRNNNRAGKKAYNSTPTYISPPPPMQIRRGSDVGETVVRSAAIGRNRRLLPAMILELESEESVERILSVSGYGYGGFDEETGDNDGGGGVAGGASGSETASLVVPVELHPVRSERNAQICFGDMKPPLPPKRTKKEETASDNNIAPLTTEAGTAGDSNEAAEGPAEEARKKQPSGSRSRAPKTTKKEEKQRQRIELLEDQVRKLLAENDRNKSDAAARAAAGSEESNEAPQSEESPTSSSSSLPSSDKPEAVARWKEKAEALQTETNQLEGKAASETYRLESELKQSMEKNTQLEESLAKWIEENSGLLQSVVEMEGELKAAQRSAKEQQSALEARHLALAEQHSDLQKQVEQSVAVLQTVVEERDSVVAELQKLKSAWQYRMETKRKLQQNNSREEDETRICIECETVRFFYHRKSSEDTEPEAVPATENSGSAANEEKSADDGVNGTKEVQDEAEPTTEPKFVADKEPAVDETPEMDGPTTTTTKREGVIFADEESAVDETPETDGPTITTTEHEVVADAEPEPDVAETPETDGTTATTMEPEAVPGAEPEPVVAETPETDVTTATIMEPEAVPGAEAVAVETTPKATVAVDA